MTREARAAEPPASSIAEPMQSCALRNDTKAGALRGVPAEGEADDTARWRVAARHDVVAGARGRPPPPNQKMQTTVA